ncbi:hypothetical protein VF21_04408 [Pseudogymnoascus sp. 05NY08]|uniref:Altered inheritance of mitochondria protein 19 n=1 Tax=Pseudogymnoascus verrucosus TaxID=342668 RepID=A0A1B8GG80_9PEZI|nr:uncharacterized protein VE01_06385 [Pseudogymnoascus verrucosus]KFY70078.1 hypothetical protein V499_09482 [Pseudogymnoascus sp. VKM F-103]KFZ06623.1 hypothetical protein V501_07233 [Pseudogymnoascus sp. VKM F-4519 (FW-2642)]OBT55174.1 hypothetical protein VE04_04480 [Pseudogymnoascus sp. 24MN13]OBT75910.1 hypothetical protein VF21_04408 [Pseudogymnoascus sp. 05NY08]OBT94830.1 hypothetical protein VE01_06385 [Pseudogymnoascus verrucosus]
MSVKDSEVSGAKKGAWQFAKAWGNSPLPPMGLATLVTAVHARPFQALPMTVPAVLLFSTYLNLNDYAKDAAGITAAWSGLYLVLANRRKSARFISRFGARGLVRGSAMGMAAVNLAACGVTYALGRDAKEEE